MHVDVLVGDILRFTVVLVRVSALIAVVPVLGVRQVPVQIKLYLAVALGLLVSLTLPASQVAAVPLDMSLVLIVLREAAIGVVLGFVASLIFRGVEYAGELIGMQMGFAVANILDPQSGSRVSIISQWQKIILVLLFFSINGHFIFVKAIHSSYELAPIGEHAIEVGAAYHVATLAGKVFVIGLQLAAPATIMLLLTHLVLAVVSRAVPQMNVFIVGFPLTIAVGVFMLAVSIPAFVQVAKGLIFDLTRDLTLVMRAF